MKYGSKRNKKSCEGQQGGTSALGTLEPMSLPDCMAGLRPLLPSCGAAWPSSTKELGSKHLLARQPVSWFGSSAGSHGGLIVN